MTHSLDEAQEEAANVIHSQDHRPRKLCDPDVVLALQLLWRAQAVQEAFQRRSEFQLLDSCKYFMDRLDSISANDYTPSDDDVLRARSRTSGVMTPQRLE